MHRLLWLVWCVAVSATAQQQVLAPGYGELNFIPPEAGSYRLPPLGQASDGEILLANDQTMRLHELMQDRIVLLSFIYTRCNEVNGCPLATHVLSKHYTHCARAVFGSRCTSRQPQF